MPRRSRQSTPELNLRAKFAASTYSSSDLATEVELSLDNFLRPYLHRNQVRLRIVVGKGTRSQVLIAGKNPLRHYTELYLQKMNLPFREGREWEGQAGVLIVEW